MKKPCLTSFDLFCSSFGAELNHKRLSVRLSHDTNDMSKICSNTCFTLKPTAPIEPRTLPSASPPPTTTQATPRQPQNHTNISIPHEDFIRKWKNFRMILEVNKLGDGQREGPRPQREECRKDGPKSKSIENLRVQNGEGKLRTC